MAVGDAFVGQDQVTLAEQWNGSTWTVRSTPDQAGTTTDLLSGVSCPTAGVCEAVGNSSTRGTTPQAALAEAWDGTAWSLQAMPTPGTSSSLASIACPTSGLCEAVGTQDNGTATLAEAWDGSAWTVQSTPDAAGAVSSTLLGVACSGTSSCTAVGTSATRVPTPSHALAEQWNGSTWTIQPTPDLAGAVGNRLLADACPLPTFCVAVGSAVKSWGDASGEGTQVTLIEDYSA